MTGMRRNLLWLGVFGLIVCNRAVAPFLTGADGSVPSPTPSPAKNAPRSIPLSDIFILPNADGPDSKLSIEEIQAVLDDPQNHQPFVPRTPLGLADVKSFVPPDNPMTRAKVELGRMLYFDPRLSSNKKVSCASCHAPAKGYSNGESVATGVGGKKGDRSAPTVINATYSRFMFWDGREPTMETQALGPIKNPIEMNMPLKEVVKKLNAIPGYKKQFRKIFGTDVTPDGIAKAIATYERTILSGDSPYDRYKSGDKTALSPAAVRGKKLFFGKANCSACHSGPNFADNGFHNLGIGYDGQTKKFADIGREAHSKLQDDRGSFKTPTLRETARTAPYMHDGSLSTLEDVVEYYDRGGTPNDYLDEEIFPLSLKKHEKADLVAFLSEGLTSPSYPRHKPPKLPR